MTFAILGSGLSALAAAHALIRRGIKPIMLDAGLELDPSIQSIVSRMSQQTSENWSKEDVEKIKRNDTVDGSGIPRKLVFGSDYVYGGEPEASFASQDIKAIMSLAKGGFANAWGAAVLPADPADLAYNWPREAIELDKNYRAIFRWLPLSAGQDALEERFPIIRQTVAALDMPCQVLPFQRSLEKIAHPNFTHGLARLAVHAEGSRKCVKCGLCLSGCIYGSIFNPTHEIDALVREGKLDYRPGYVIKQISESYDSVQVIARRGNTLETLIFSRVFLACGAISTTRIMLASMGAQNKKIYLADSQKFVVPLFRLKAANYAVSNTHSLAAMFLETRVPSLRNNWMHIQVSSINDFVLRRLRADRSKIRQLLLDPILRRMLIGWGSMHSDHSARLEVWLRSDGVLDAAENNFLKASANVRTALAYFNRLIYPSGTWAPAMLATKSRVGSSNHIGASFPMTESPSTRFESDILGRPAGWSRTHIVDAAILPSIPATTMSLLMMATSDRIASQAPLE